MEEQEEIKTKKNVSVKNKANVVKKNVVNKTKVVKENEAVKRKIKIERDEVKKKRNWKTQIQLMSRIIIKLRSLSYRGKC